MPDWLGEDAWTLNQSVRLAAHLRESGIDLVISGQHTEYPCDSYFALYAAEKLGHKEEVSWPNQSIV